MTDAKADRSAKQLLEDAQRWVHEHKTNGRDSFGEFQVTEGEMRNLQDNIGVYRDAPFQTICGMKLKVIPND
jgi:hypothetical protein